MINYNTREDRIFALFNYSAMVLLMLVTLYPFWYTLVGSFNEGYDYTAGGVYFWPRKFTLENYQAVFLDNRIMDAYKVTIARTVVGTFTRLLVCSLFAYAFSRPKLMGKGIYAAIGIVSMYFHGGIIPDYINIKDLGLLDTFMVYIWPRMFNFFNVLIIAAFFREISNSVVESAKMDGASDYRVFLQIMLPLSKPVLAAIALFAAVNHWNAFFDAMMYVNDRRLYVLQLLLMEIIKTQEQATVMAMAMDEVANQQSQATSTTIQLATMVTAIGPILLVYPFVQKYFVKGIMIGSVKG
jgi:putative aldouronate transport system permease protein